MRRFFYLAALAWPACAGGLTFTPDASSSANDGAVEDLASPSMDLTGVDLAGADLAGADVTMPDLAGSDLAGRDLSSAALPDLALPPGDMALPLGTFVAVGYGGRRVLSSDTGQTWTNDQNDMAGDNGDDLYLIRDVGWGGGAWLTAGGFNGFTWTSSDGKNWVGKNNIDQWFGNVTFAKGIWVAVGGFGRRSTSSDGVHWTDHYDSAGDGYRAGTFGNYLGGRWVAVGDGGRVSESSDGTNWTVGAGVPATYSLGTIAFGGGVFVAAQSSSTNFVRSTDGGANWTSGALPANVDDIAYGQGKFVAIGSEMTMTSSDGMTWSGKAVTGLGGTVAFGNNSFVAVNGTNTYFSSDGTTWTSKSNFPSGTFIVRIRFGGTL